ncbi:MAG: membrane protein insertase YidC [Treponema sp.]|nr:membrane protein insertase YidC [Treponema sp.]
MLSAIYNIIIFPLTQLLEFCYQFVFEATGKEAIAVIFLSFIVTLCTLPLYMVAESWQDIERATQKKLKTGIDRIKKAFKGDEQYMILNTYYKQNHYSPIMALRSSFSLLIQVPFFLAAYHFLSDLGTLKGVSFLFIKDFGSPDATFHIGAFAINVLPIAMTIINCCSGYIYSKGHPIQEKIQIYAFAAIFLIVLYNSPAGLVVYWTMNNILSLVKNIFYKLKNPKKTLYILLCIFSLICIASPFTILSNRKNTFRLAICCFGVILPFIPFAVIAVAKLIDKNFKKLEKNAGLRCSIFYFSAITLAVLCGLIIPSMLIESEPNNYCYVDSYKSPFIFLFTPFWQAIGFFVFWPAAFYGLFSVRIKKALTVLFSSIAVLALANCFIFGGSYGPIYPELLFMQPQDFMPNITHIIINLLVLAVLFITVILLLSKLPKFMHSAMIIVILAGGVISLKNIVSIKSDYDNMTPPSYNDELEPIFHLSKTGKNVIVIMQDRCFSPFLPYVFEELPELKEKYDGFHWYPNTVSMGKLTMIGTPGLFGGYDYTPFKMNEWTEKDLQDKHNEALLTLPLIFSENGYIAQVANLPYENYLEQPEYNMYMDNEDLKKEGIEIEEHSDPSENPYTVKYKGHKTIQHNTVLGTYTNRWYAQHNQTKDPYISSQILRNFIWFSFFKIVPPFLRGGIYHKNYWRAYNKWDDTARFVDNYSVHDYLPELTDFYEDSYYGEENKGSLIVLDNEATHEPILLQAPEYEYTKKATNHGNSPLAMDTEFSTMCGIFNRFSEFIDYLKENNCYDNTKIIIVSDHGMYDTSSSHKGATKLLKTDSSWNFAKCNFVATLLVKDFNSHGSFEVPRLSEENLNKLDMTFMTNADTPYLATKDLIDDAINPFTKKSLKVENKNDYTILNTAKPQSTRIRKEKQFDVANHEWYTVRDNIFVDSNWSPLYESK